MTDTKEPLAYVGDKATQKKLGVDRFATAAEAQAGTRKDVAMSPSTLRSGLAAPGAIGGTTPAAGTFTTLTINGSGGPQILAGSGAPSSTVAKGTLYIRLDGSSTSTRMYIATDNAGTWTNFVTAA
jgi:hypothetical protein